MARARVPLIEKQAAWPQIPDDVVDWIRDAFAEANRAVCETLVNVPSIRETSLDDALVQNLIPRSAPSLMPSGAVVRMDIHNIGGLRQHRKWEIADIGVLVFVIRAGRIIARKVALLQAKRLYPSNNEVDEDDDVGFLYGMNKFLMPDESPTSMLLQREFEFISDCTYGALKSDSQQVNNIDSFKERSEQEVYYLFYNPNSLPLRIKYPLKKRKKISNLPSIGCEVFTATDVHSLLKRMDAGASPAYHQIAGLAPLKNNVRLEHWAADLLLTCQVGRRYEPDDEDALLPILQRRSGPIGAAIAVNIELSE
jgi:hypothetical protein